MLVVERSAGVSCFLAIVVLMFWLRTIPRGYSSVSEVYDMNYQRPASGPSPSFGVGPGGFRRFWKGAVVAEGYCELLSV